MTDPDWPEIAAAVSGLDLSALRTERWFADKDAAPEAAELVHAFVLPGTGSGGDGRRDPVLAVVAVHLGGRRQARYALPLVRVADGWQPAAPGDGAWAALGRAIAESRVVPALSPTAGPVPGPVEAALVCRPAPGLDALLAGHEALGRTERPLGHDQSNTSTVVGERLLLKAFRRLQPGLNPDLEMTAYLSEEASFPGVPRLAGWAELVERDGAITTVALLQELVADAQDAYETVAERLADWIAAPGEVALEWATEIAADLGALTAALHGALASPPADAPDFRPREAARAQVRSWAADARRSLDEAIMAVAGVDAGAAAELRDLAPSIAARFSRFEATPVTPIVMRIHADLHLGQVLIAPDGFRVVDFEGEPSRPVEERRQPDSPLRDVASMLRSLDHVGRSARRRAARRLTGDADAPLPRSGLDVEAWLDRARERFIASYRDGLREQGAPIAVDEDLLEAFEFAKEAYEFGYAARQLPDWLWAPREGMRGLIARFGRGS